MVWNCTEHSASSICSNKSGKRNVLMNVLKNKTIYINQLSDTSETFPICDLARFDEEVVGMCSSQFGSLNSRKKVEPFYLHLVCETYSITIMKIHLNEQYKYKGDMAMIIK